MASNLERNKLFIIPKPVNSPRLRIFCFPYAGGSAKTYLDWAEHFTDDIEIVAVQPPGRTTRLDEAPYENLYLLINELMTYRAFITQVPYAFIGHSLGCRMAFELACKLQSGGYPAPVHFFASGCTAPHLRHHFPDTHDLPHDEFIHELRKMNGTTDEVLQHSELMDFLLPLLRADFKMAETYQAKPCLLKSPITALRGDSDPDIKPIELYAWSELSSEGLTVQSIPGGHFFIDQNKEKVIEVVSALLTKEPE
ncbi:thioesterase II family protein [Xenorhabdus innexi]|uniref:Pyochelin biosynthetic protein PchC n=1 Tax=Xenorhabdus innexi TaxID=290109 RepID=A0A1N6N0A4_9GAMM|nr:thioesterase domain-containing protein [Xenorhabdus innexi]PHM37676.1 pyochelin biosynthetic protein PchC [Xenorhabdus innexi]SIP74495.1 Thioesterase (modular protein) [Xenorhabdus innexi]